MADTLTNLAGGAGAVLACLVIFAFIYWNAQPKPSDLTHIKAHLEGNQHQVVDVTYAGFVGGGRNHPSYRKYRVMVRSPLSGLDEEHMVGVSADFFTSGTVVEFGHARHRDFG